VTAKKTSTKKAATKGAKGTKPAAKAMAASKNGDANPKKLSALDAAAKVLDGSEKSLNTRTMIEAVAVMKQWTSAGGATPHATLYSAILREINAKGRDAQFKKTERGPFAFHG
jgi:hypothetical protein